MKKCTKCGIEKEETEFAKRSKDKYQAFCKECANADARARYNPEKDRIRGKKYREENSEKNRQRAKEYYQRNKEEIQKKHLDYHHANKEQINEHGKEYYRKNCLEIRRKQAEYRKEHKEEAYHNSLQWRKYNPEKHREYHREYRKRRNYVYDKVQLALKDGTLIKSKRCELCGIGGYIEGHHEDYDKPHEVVWCCKKCHSLLDKVRRLREKRSKD